MENNIPVSNTWTGAMPSHHCLANPWQVREWHISFCLVLDKVTGAVNGGTLTLSS